MTCRFGENRRSLRRPVQKLLTARLPTAFKPPAAEAAYPRFPTSPTGPTTMICPVLPDRKKTITDCPGENNVMYPLKSEDYYKTDYRIVCYRIIWSHG